jgi:ubiquinone/menaquinone biosynthesis C-methylase UbiE
MDNRLNTIKSYYESNIGKNLPDYSFLGWESEEAQMLRFDMIVSNVTLQEKKILDVGCGVGNFVEYLVNKGINSQYTGVDILDSMISLALKKNLNSRFLQCDLFKENPFGDEKFDVVYSSGIFNLNLDNNMDFLHKAIRIFLGLSNDIVAFNLLSTTSLDKEDRYYYYDMEEVNRLVKDGFSKDIKTVKFIHGYLHNDFTVICSKKGAIL